ncbi:MAG: hypothetical protein J0H48_10990 [Nitrosospira multiformis]|nr:hypothetical protein [Nitrosospira multiformis]
MSTPLEMKKKQMTENSLLLTLLLIIDDPVSYKRNEAQKIMTILGMENCFVLYGDTLITEVEFAQV